ncbi:RNB domain-containing ribonuclease [Parenemella sanctibonifatiensis]|uniref:RNB domain-containing ribonuclease n=1 Tax=Parenemella sanctibonifatiensis TaxID=2016505 RepID=UPI001E5F3BB1|nr:RNB domain-containing ribonuclease [Parenemella sanctibonifatiensis]
MPARHLRSADGAPAPIAEGIARLREELEVPDDFPSDVTAAAIAAAKAAPMPERDLREVPFVAIDPPGAQDVDQLLHLERDAEGFLVWYAIADLGSFVEPGGVIDAEAHRRGQTFYAPSGRTPLHPPELSEGAASLLEGQDRPALVWQHRLDAEGALTETTVERALVRNRRQLTYEQVQADLDAGNADPALQLLAEVGQLRQAQERARGGVSLNLPDQEVEATDGRWQLSFRSTLPVEGWNAQISLLTGIAAAKLMIEAKVGILRTLPPAEPDAERTLRETAELLGIDWPADMPYQDFVPTLDTSIHSHSAMMNACTLLFRGAGYQAFDGEVPEQPLHAAMATPYAHCTAPLRRLVDRYTLETCLALVNGQRPADWVLAAYPELPDTMRDSDRRAKAYERGIVDLVEALVLQHRVGDTFTAVVVDVDEAKPDATRFRGRIVVEADAVEATVTADRELPLGEQVQVRLTAVDLVAGTVDFELA